MALARVRGDVEEIESSSILQELPGSGSYCPLCVGELDAPKELPLDHRRPATQDGQKIEPVGFIGGWNRRAGGGENRRRQIHGDRHLLGSSVRRQVARPPEYQGDTNSAFPERTLPIAERRIAREPLAAVVIREDDQRVPGETPPFERGENLPDALVRSLEHANVIAACGGSTHGRTLIQCRKSLRRRWRRCIVLGVGRQTGNIE